MSGYPLGLFSLTIPPGEKLEFDASMDEVQITGLTFSGEDITGEGRSTVKLTYFDRPMERHQMFTALMAGDYSDSEDEDDDDDSDTEGYPIGLDSDDDSQAESVDDALIETGEEIDEEALLQAIQKNKSAKKAKIEGLLNGMEEHAKSDALMPEDQDLVASDDDDDQQDSDEDSEGSYRGEGDIVTMTIGTLIPGKIEHAPVNLVLKYGEAYGFEVTGTNPVQLQGHYVFIPPPFPAGREGDSDYGSTYDSEDDDLSSGEEGMFDPDQDDDDSRFEELETAAAASLPKKESKKEKKEKKSKNVPAAPVDDLSMDVEEAAVKPAAAPAKADTSAADVSMDGLSKNQRKKLAKQQKKAAAEGAPSAPAVTGINGTKTETVKVDKSGKKTVEVSTSAEVSVTPAGSGSKEEVKATAKKASKKTTLPSGLVIEDVKVGSGGAAKKGQKVSMRYIGKLDNGKVFDSNTKGAPFTFKLGAGEVIAGWDQGIAGMQPGGERRLTIPAKLGYGKNGTQGIPGNATLTFEVKCISLK